MKGINRTKPARLAAILIVLMLGIPAACQAPSHTPPKVTQTQPSGHVPDFTLTECLNADTLRLSELLDRPVLLFFYDAGDVPSIRAFPYVKEWHRRYQGDGLKVIGIHSPFLEPLRMAHNAIEVAARARLKFAIGMDMERTVYQAYGIEKLPTFIVVKPGGEVVLRTDEGRSYQKTEEAIQRLLKELRPDIIHPFLFKPVRLLDDPAVSIQAPSPPILPGWRSGVIEGFDSTLAGKFHTYTDSREKDKAEIYLSGRWKVDELSITHSQKGGQAEDYVRIIYTGKDVWILPFFEYGSSPSIYIKQDRSFLPRLSWGADISSDPQGRPFLLMRYSIPIHIVSNPTHSSHELQIIAGTGDVSLYCLSFEGDVAE
jgi:peroxiredoxin